MGDEFGDEIERLARRLVAAMPDGPTAGQLRLRLERSRRRRSAAVLAVGAVVALNGLVLAQLRPGGELGSSPAATTSSTTTSSTTTSSTTTSTTTTSSLPNRPPVAADNLVSTLTDQPQTFDVLANDSDPDGDSLTVVSVSVGGAPAIGTVSINGSNTITFTPPAGFVGVAEFTYTVIDDGGLTATARVTIVVNPPPAAG